LERLYRVEAVVLKRVDFGEADRLLTLYTQERGKVRALAKGSRKTKSRLAGHVELLGHSKMLIAAGRNLDIITQSMTLKIYRPIRENLSRLAYAYYLAELVDRFTEEGMPNIPVYRLLLDGLGWLAETTDLNLTARFLEMCLLGHLGYRPSLFQCVSCEANLMPEVNFFSLESGGTLCPKCASGEANSRAISLNGLKVLRFLQVRSYQECCRLRLSPRVRRELEDLMQQYLTYTLEKDLKSVGFLRTLRRQMRSAGG